MKPTDGPLQVFAAHCARCQMKLRLIVGCPHGYTHAHKVTILEADLPTTLKPGEQVSLDFISKRGEPFVLATAVVDAPDEPIGPQTENTTIHPF